MNNNSKQSDAEIAELKRKAESDANSLINKINGLTNRQNDLKYQQERLAVSIRESKEKIEEAKSVKSGFFSNAFANITNGAIGRTSDSVKNEHHSKAMVAMNKSNAEHAQITAKLSEIVKDLSDIVRDGIALSAGGFTYTHWLHEKLAEDLSKTTGTTRKIGEAAAAQIRKIKEGLEAELKKQQAVQEQYDNVDQRLAEKENIDKQQTKDIAFLKEAAKQKIETDEQQNKEIEFLKRAATYKTEVDQKQEKHIETLKIAADQNIETDRQQSQAISALEQEANENLQRDKELASRFENTEQTILSKAKAANITSIIALVVALAAAVKTFLLS